MTESNLLRSILMDKRNVAVRVNAKTAEHTRILHEHRQMVFDGPREYSHGGFYYDGRR